MIALVPVVLGEGIPLFATTSGQELLRLTEARTFPSGIVMLDYEPEAGA